MKKYKEIIEAVELFKGIDNLEAMLECLGAEIKRVRKEEIILLAGEKPLQVGIVLEGQLNVYKEDYDGNRSLMTIVESTGIYGEALCCAGVEESPVTVIADRDSVVMRLGFMRIVQTCTNACPFHILLIKNMLEVIANRNLQLQKRMEIISLKSIRAKVLRYFELYTPKKGKEIVIPFNREEMANFLCVERSALSHELSCMKKEGLIEYRKNRFEIKNC